MFFPAKTCRQARGNCRDPNTARVEARSRHLSSFPVRQSKAIAAYLWMFFCPRTPPCFELVRQLLRALSLIMLFCSKPAYAAETHVEPQAAPASSEVVRTHPTRSDLYASLGANGEVSLWQITGPLTSARLLALREIGSALDLISDPIQPLQTAIVVGTHLGELRIYDVNGKLLHSVATKGGADIDFVVHSDVDKIIATLDDEGTLDLWSLDGRPLNPAVFSGTSRPTGLVSIPQFSLLIATFRNGLLKVVDLKRGNAVSEMALAGEGLGEGLHGIGAAADGTKVVIAFGGSIRLFDIPTLLRRIGGDESASGSLVFKGSIIGETPLLFAQGNAGIIGPGKGGRGLRFISFGEKLADDSGHDSIEASACSSLALSCDGSVVVSGSRSSPPRLWTLGLSQETPPIRAAAERISSVAIAPSSPW